MNVTKNDLCSDGAKLDFEAMRKTALYAVGALLNQAERHIGALHELHCTSYGLEAVWLAEVTAKLAIAAETCDTLQGAQDRHEIEIVNKPEVK